MSESTIYSRNVLVWTSIPVAIKADVKKVQCGNLKKTEQIQQRGAEDKSKFTPLTSHSFMITGIFSLSYKTECKILIEEMIKKAY